jgi:uncharacterized membrane protein YidH (DUF202 family)
MDDERVNKRPESETIIINEVQLLLAEKRTSLATMRAGIAVFALPLSVLGFLVATSRYYVPMHVIQWLIPLLVISMAMVVLGSYLIIKSIVKIHHFDMVIKEIKRQHGRLAQFID